MAPRKQFLLRLDPALYAELESWASAELRSVNAQMEYLLRQAVNARKGGRGAREPVRAGSARGVAGGPGDRPAPRAVRMRTTTGE